MLNYTIEYVGPWPLRDKVLMNGETYSKREAIDIILWQHNNGRQVQVFVQYNDRLSGLIDELRSYNVKVGLVYQK